MTKPIILVTGGAGYIGSMVVAHLLPHVESLFVVDRFDRGPGILQALEGDKRLQVVQSDIADPFWDRGYALPQFDAVIHLAAVVGEGATKTRGDDDCARSNSAGTRNIVDVFGGKVVFASTCSVYGQTGPGLAIEQDAPSPQSLYAETKLDGERQVMKAGGIALRFGTVVGMSYNMRWDTIANSMAAAALLPGRSYMVYGADLRRPLCSMRSALRAIFAATKHVISGESQALGHVFNIADGNFAKHEIVRMVVEAAKPGAFNDVVMTNAAPNSRDYAVNCDAARVHFAMYLDPVWVRGAIRTMLDSGIMIGLRMLDMEKGVLQ